MIARKPRKSYRKKPRTIKPGIDDETKPTSTKTQKTANIDNEALQAIKKSSGDEQTHDHRRSINAYNLMASEQYQVFPSLSALEPRTIEEMMEDPNVLSPYHQTQYQF